MQLCIYSLYVVILHCLLLHMYEIYFIVVCCLKEDYIAIYKKMKTLIIMVQLSNIIVINGNLHTLFLILVN